MQLAARLRLALAAWLALASCNSILGNSDFHGSGSDPDRDAGVEDTCTPRGLPRTTLTGTVFAPNGTLPIYNALVYAPTDPLADLPDGASGPTCASGAPVAMAHTDSRGKFQLVGAPSGANVPIVVQIGKWRRAVTVPDVPECATTALDPATTRLPRDRSEGHIPHIAIGTGFSDNIECIARDLGIADSEITTGPTSTGRVRLYHVTGSSALASTGAAIEPAASLITADGIRQYDAVMLGCPGADMVAATTPAAQALLDYTNQGGWLWLGHRSHLWLDAAPAPWSTIGTFTPDTTNNTMPASLVIDPSSPRGQAFADWAVGVGASPAPGIIPVQNAIGSCKRVDSSITRTLLTLDPADGHDVEMFTWDARMGGRLVFSDVHRPTSVLPPGGSLTAQYPTNCTALVPQDLAILFEVFDVPSCDP